MEIEKINLTGEKASFEQPAQIADPLLETGRKQFGITYLFPYQRLVIRNILDTAEALYGPLADTAGTAPDGTPLLMPEGAALNTETDTRNHQIIILPTGAGKSLCFMLPGALLPGITLIIFPLLALMADQLRRIEEAGMRGVTLKGGQKKVERDRIWEEVKSGKVRFILTNPETLKGEKVMERLRELPVIHGVIDEAHTVNEWGKSFRPSYLELGHTLKNLGIPIITAFTATASPEVMTGIREIVFHGDDVHTIMGNPDRENITYRIIPTVCPEYDIGRFLFPFLADGSPNPEALPRPAIIFCQSRTSAELTAERLREMSGEKEIYFYHAGLTREEKAVIEEWFFHSARGILTATCAYGMGVDKKNIRTVIHREPPSTVEAYLQESGRGGRDRQPARAIMFVPWKPIPEADKKHKDGRKKAETAGTRPSLSREEAFKAGIMKNNRCRREVFINLLGGESEYCAGCDVCGRKVQQLPRGAVEIMKLLRSRPGYYNKRQIQFLLAGRGSSIIMEDRLCESRHFGILSAWGPDQIGEAIDSMNKVGILKLEKRGVVKGKYKLSRTGRKLSCPLVISPFKG